ncbi:DsbE family thiol:disulfide interchange protein [Marinicella gelatinilytica]|uniref:DsbE family thiol:disulfide interchange protein n=1 Tax=Marinicella gelatinilytica TaxID=2996017 RepID=UPI002260E0BB|nr:DsbE family thiol:disulfide interchange protein [Marinicella gelatinilytica]MCX7543964.1 DsbE family thiol:disulfide interchange protein [Marinicella gelatinilytica]
MKKIVITLIPLALFFGLVTLLFLNMGYHNEHVPSPLIGKSVPSFELPLLYEDKTMTEQDFIGEPWLLNVWGSWCPNCLYEHPVVTDLAQSGKLKVVGLNWKDEFSDADNWLKRLGNPYDVILVDYVGNTAIDFGVYGAPESFLIDANGIIVHKIVGELTPENVANEILPKLAQLQ